MNTLLLLTSFVAGVLTVLAPCSLTLLPVILSTSVRGFKKILFVIAGLSVSIFVFSILLKASTALLSVPLSFWDMFSGALLLVLGLIFLFPNVWYKLEVKLGLSQKSQKALSSSQENESSMGDFLVGMSLGPVFSSCSPTYLLIVATILPADIGVGIVYLLAYIIGLALILLAVGFFGSKAQKLMRSYVKYDALIKKISGVVIIALGIIIFFGFHKDIETWLIANELIFTIDLEQNILNKIQ